MDNGLTQISQTLNNFGIQINKKADKTYVYNNITNVDNKKSW